MNLTDVAIMFYSRRNTDDPITLNMLSETFGFKRKEIAKEYRRLFGRDKRPN